MTRLKGPYYLGPWTIRFCHSPLKKVVGLLGRYPWNALRGVVIKTKGIMGYGFKHGKFGCRGWVDVVEDLGIGCRV